MCGLVGFWGRGLRNLSEIVTPMNDAISYRGPDSSGVWSDEGQGIALAHRRLAILDLSPAGHQPMISSSGRFIIIFNGEVYNYLELRKDLEHLGRTFRGGSDTEVLLEAFEEWGIAPTLAKCNGMLAIALWDKETRSLTLARDKIGKKPLYYGYCGPHLLFGSELKALRPFPQFSNQISRHALSLFLRYGYIPSPLSIFENIFKLPAGSFLTVKEGDRTLTPLPYWSLTEIAQTGVRSPFTGDDVEAEAKLHSILLAAVKTRMLSDVPLGALLSGGIDSSLVVALMQSAQQAPIKTFSIGFEEEAFNEAHHAEKVARHLGTDHMALYVTPREALEVVPLLGTMYDEPFADSSQIPTYLVAKLARSKVTVALSGDGGDESFAGYSRYLWGKRAWRIMGYLTTVGRRSVSRLLRCLSENQWDSLFIKGKSLIPSNFTFKDPGVKVHRLAHVMSARNSQEFYHRLVSYWDEPVVCDFDSTTHRFTTLPEQSNLSTFLEEMMLTDMLHYLPDDILVKVDRATMAVSLEARAPLLDPNVISFAWTLPERMKLRDGEAKWLLKKVLYRYVPKTLVDRPKMGFGVPIASWLRGPLKAWASELLSEQALSQGGYLDPAPIRLRWREHLEGKRNWQYHLWTVLMWQSWRGNYSE